MEENVTSQPERNVKVLWIQLAVWKGFRQSEKKKENKKRAGEVAAIFTGRSAPSATNRCLVLCLLSQCHFFLHGGRKWRTHTRERERKRFLSCVRRDGWLTDDEGVGSSHVRVEPSLLRMCRRLWPLLLVRWRFETRTTAARWALVPRRVFLLGALHCWRGAACALATSSSTTYRCCVDRRR